MLRLWRVKSSSLSSKGWRRSLFLLLHHQLIFLLVNKAMILGMMCLSVLLGRSIVHIRISFWVRAVSVLLPFLGFFPVFGPVSRSWSSPIPRVVRVRRRSLLLGGTGSGIIALHGCVRRLITPFISGILLDHHNRLNWLRRSSLSLSQLDQVYIWWRD